MRDLLDTLGDRSVATALVTSAPSSWYAILLERWELGRSFDETVSAGELDGSGNPAPLICEDTAERLDVDPSAMLAVEDSEHGIAAAGAAGP